MGNYYREALNGPRLAMVYDTAIERVRRFLEAEIGFVRGSLAKTDSVLELGAGYGRIVKALAPTVGDILGIDIAEGSIAYGQEYLRGLANARLELMDAYALPFRDRFDAVLCLQNGISAMKGRSESLVSGALATLKPGGRLFLSTYSPHFWEPRLAWFEEQAAKGLLGALDREATRDGEIRCVDGFSATTVSEAGLRAIGARLGSSYELVEVDDSSLFLIVTR